MRGEASSTGGAPRLVLLSLVYKGNMIASPPTESER